MLCSLLESAVVQCIVHGADIAEQDGQGSKLGLVFGLAQTSNPFASAFSCTTYSDLPSSQQPSWLLTSFL